MQRHQQVRDYSSNATSSSSAAATGGSSNEAAAGGANMPPILVPYRTQKMGCGREDIIFCVDADRQMEADMKPTSAKGQALTRLDAVKQAILLFVHSKLAMNPQHRFAFASLGHSASWNHKDFTNDISSITTAVRRFEADSLYIHSDLSQLFRIACSQANKSKAESRILRVILIYCRSSVVPEFASHWLLGQKLFTLDVIYLHDKPNRDNCPQKVFDALCEAVEQVSEFEGYIFESGTSITRVLFRQMCILLSHPQQRCLQDDLDLPKSLKAANQAEAPLPTPSSHSGERGQPRDLLTD